MTTFTLAGVALQTILLTPWLDTSPANPTTARQRFCSVLRFTRRSPVTPIDAIPSDEGSLLWTLEEIGRLVSVSGDPTETLTNVVHLIQRRFETQVCFGLPARTRSQSSRAGGDDRSPSGVRRSHPHADQTRGSPDWSPSSCGRRSSRTRPCIRALNTFRRRRGDLPLVSGRSGARSRPAPGRPRRPDR